jgi:VWFA-related protein
MKTLRNARHFSIAFLSVTLLVGISALSAMAQMDSPSIAQSSLIEPGMEATEQPSMDAGDAKEDARYADGSRAIQENRWADAEAIFTEIAAGHGERADAALYWKAFAENKQGKSDAALKGCAELRQSYPKSRWVDDCGALEIEVRGKNGQPVEPQSQSDENLKLLALNTLMRRDESKALPQIEQILTSDQPETFKEHALFVLAQSTSKQAQQMLAQVANPLGDAPASIRLNAALRQRAQQLISAGRDSQPGGSRHLGVDAVVTDKAGKPLSGLDASNFTVLDNGHPQKILSFYSGDESTTRRDPPAKVMILIDTVNASLEDVAYERQQIAIFLRQNGGQLANPVSILYFNGDGAQSVAPVSQDGNALAAALDKQAPNLHPIRRSEAFYGAVERVQISLSALGSLASKEAAQPGRKVLLWISPGWPLLVGTQAYPSQRELETFFDGIVGMSATLRRARITLYSVDPARAAGTNSQEWFRYKDYLKPVIKVSQAQVANLSLQVLAEQSGGHALTYSKDYLSGEISAALAGIDHYYYLIFDAPPAKQADEYHALKISVDKPGVEVRTRSGYYDQP